MQVNGPDGEVTSIPGLEYVTVEDGQGQDISGFDIIGVQDLITIADNYEITSTSEKKDTWEVNVIFVNLDSDQTSNGGKKFNGKLQIRKSNITVSEQCTNKNFAECFKKYYKLDNALYYHKDLENSAEDGSVRYAGHDYDLTELGASKYSNVNDSSKNANGIIKQYCSRGSTYCYVGSSCNGYYTRYFYLAYDEEKTQYSSYLEAIQQAVKDGYIKENIKNYVCIGSDDEVCPHDNMYRIIGVIDDKVKLIKADFAKATELGTSDAFYNAYKYWELSDNLYYSMGKNNMFEIGTYYYSNASNSTNNWKDSRLNKINLNTNYLNKFSEQWQAKIADTDWQIGGQPEYKVTAAEAYNSEIVNPEENIVETKKIAMMYISDYAYAAIPDAWSTAINSLYNYRFENWINLGIGMYDWTLTKNKDFQLTRDSFPAFVLNGSRGEMTSGFWSSTGEFKHAFAVRPVFFLNQDVIKTTGDGSYQNPIRVE